MARSPFAMKSPAEAGPNASAVKAKSMSIASRNPKPTQSSSTTALPAAPSDEEDEGDEVDLAQQINRQTKKQFVRTKDLLGSGTYAEVWKGYKAAEPSTLVAIKRIKIKAETKSDGLALDPIREIRFLQELSHPNIITLHAVFSSKGQTMNLVLEFLPRGDFKKLITQKSGVYYDLPIMKTWMGMIMRGVWFCHENFVLHRDLKPENILVGDDGELKIADFGMARSFADPGRRMTAHVVTSWYRPLELFFGAKYYSGAIDIWSLGVIFAEMVKKRPIITGMSDLETTMQICKLFGTPTEKNWPGCQLLDNFSPTEEIFPIKTRAWWRNEFGVLLDDGADLVMSMMSLDPRGRPSARQILQHGFWGKAPRPADKQNLPRTGGGTEAMGKDLGRAPGENAGQRGDKVARKLDFGAVR